MSVTEQDRERARELGRVLLSGVLTPLSMAPVIAAALADERDRARAPFLAVADDYWGAGVVMGSAVAQDIRLAAEDPR